MDSKSALHRFSRVSIAGNGRLWRGYAVSTVYISRETHDLDTSIHTGDGYDDHRASACGLVGAAPGLPSFQQVDDGFQARLGLQRHY